jgi:hypothetical protein
MKKLSGVSVASTANSADSASTAQNLCRNRFPQESMTFHRSGALQSRKSTDIVNLVVNDNMKRWLVEHLVIVRHKVANQD